jgi:hypothetical protein
MTENDLSRLLRDGTPEPRRALSADDLLRRARRRRALVSSATVATAAVAVAGVAVVVAVSRQGTVTRPPVAATSGAAPPAPAATSPEVPLGTPLGDTTRTSRGRPCTRTYPEGLADHAYAIVARITKIEPHPDTQAMFRVRMDVEEVLAGGKLPAVWFDALDFTLPPDPSSLAGKRVYLAADDSVLLPGCGYARMFDNPADAQQFRRAFIPGPEKCGITQHVLLGYRAAQEYVGLSVAAAEELARSRHLEPRFVGDRLPPGAVVDGEQRYDRVTLCDRGGVITAAGNY